MPWIKECGSLKPFFIHIEVSDPPNDIKRCDLIKSDISYDIETFYKPHFCFKKLQISFLTNIVVPTLVPSLGPIYALSISWKMIHRKRVLFTTSGLSGALQLIIINFCIVLKRNLADFSIRIVRIFWEN